MNKNDPPVVVEYMYDASVKSVWDAITQIDQMHQWYFDNISAFEPTVGFETQFTVESQGRKFHHQWKVTEVIPLKKIKYNWKYAGYAGDSDVIFELFSKNSSTMLRVTNQILESFPDNIPEFTRDSCITGWTFLIKERLKEFLEKST